MLKVWSDGQGQLFHADGPGSEMMRVNEKGIPAHENG